MFLCPVVQLVSGKAGKQGVEIHYQPIHTVYIGQFEVSVKAVCKLDRTEFFQRAVLKFGLLCDLFSFPGFFSISALCEAIAALSSSALRWRCSSASRRASFSACCNSCSEGLPFNNSSLNFAILSTNSLSSVSLISRVRRFVGGASDIADGGAAG